MMLTRVALLAAVVAMHAPRESAAQGGGTPWKVELLATAKADSIAPPAPYRKLAGQIPGQRWVIVTIAVTPPSKDSRVPCDQVALSVAGTTFTPRYVAFRSRLQDSVAFQFVFADVNAAADSVTQLEQSIGGQVASWVAAPYTLKTRWVTLAQAMGGKFVQGFAAVATGGSDPVFFLMPGPTPGQGEFRFSSKRRILLTLLYNVPPASGPMTLTFADAGPVEIP